jgi:TolB-like protein
VVSFECLEEFEKDLLLGLLATEDIGVGLSRVDTLDVVNVNVTTLILVELVVGLSD